VESHNPCLTLSISRIALFTGLRRRRNIREMLPEDGLQFKYTELRKIPALPSDFLQEIEQQD
ncbi:hypothetical protein, partial [Candidatus Entotheonella palauensis]|uniref:hypothetical protein n=1 Tax=Candidatus Entotheonella palauensis TaxID=93172 RepID=UPI001C4E1F44